MNDDDDDDDDNDHDDDVLQVFLTVNSLAKVYWDGTFEKRRLELNWVNPPDVQRKDYVGLFRVDPQWFGISSEISFNCCDVVITKSACCQSLLSACRRCTLVSISSPLSSSLTSLVSTPRSWPCRPGPCASTTTGSPTSGTCGDILSKIFPINFHFYIIFKIPKMLPLKNAFLSSQT